MLNSTGTDLMWIHSNDPSNIFIGVYAGRYNNPGGGGAENIFIGNYAGNLNYFGTRNTAIGVSALYNTTTGNFNTAIGYDAHFNNTIGNGNTACGINAFVNNYTGNYNTVLGYNVSCKSGVSPDNFTALGNAAGYVGSNSNTIEIGNTGITWIGGNVG